MNSRVDVKTWLKARVKPEQINKYLINNCDFIPDAEIDEKIETTKKPDSKKIKDILAKSLAVKTLEPDETAALLKVTDPVIWNEMIHTAGEVKKKVYDNRIVTFAPLYLGNHCVNNCLYCGFRNGNVFSTRRILSLKEVKKETEVLAGEIGHKRLIAVYGEHPATGAEYIVNTLKTIYAVKIKTKNGHGEIRRVNVNAAPMSIEDLTMLESAGIGTYQVFQETYRKDTYDKVHPKGTIKNDYRWRLYSMHRAFEAGIDDVGIGALFGLYDWRFEVMGLLYHARELERVFGIGPHTISFPRLEPAANTSFVQNSIYRVSDENFKKIVTILRLSIPYAGMILTAREPAKLRHEVIPLGITQIDASTKIGIGAYSDRRTDQEEKNQQFILGDTRSLDETIGELAKEGRITSFCTAGYRCDRTGKCIMELLRTGQEGKFCKLNAILTFREWLDDFASFKTRSIGEKVIKKEIKEIKEKLPQSYPRLMECYKRIKNGERDLYF